ncbi:MAG: UDP-N-acetylmuramoyl-tripeptide--D-alanyl-D-alanine ligase [Sphingobacterium sp.]
MLIPQLYQIFLQYPTICTDTRSIQKGCLFFALKGANFNGNQFAEQALLSGAQYVVVDDEHFYRQDAHYILVDDVLHTLQSLARFHREHLAIPVIGITGTNGKTTTKELLLSVLCQKYKTFATKGNLNNHIGVPLSILSLTSDIEIAIIEMGANQLHEISLLCDMARPTHGLITNVGKAHLEGFGSFQGVKEAKSELYAFLQQHGGTVFIQGDNEHLLEMATERNLGEMVSYGLNSTNYLQGGLIAADPYLLIYWEQTNTTVKHEVRTHLTGTYNLENMLAAVVIGLYFKLDPQQINQGLATYRPQNNRSQIIRTARNLIIADFYNANASSMSAALDNLQQIQGERKAIILGDMFEMGEESLAEHQILRDKAYRLGFDALFFVGQTFYSIRDNQAEYFQSTEELVNRLETLPLVDHTILLKASRGMAFETLMKLL